MGIKTKMNSVVQYFNKMLPTNQYENKSAPVIKEEKAPIRKSRKKKS